MTRHDQPEGRPAGVGTPDDHTPAPRHVDGSAIKTEWDARALTDEIKKAIDRIGNLPEMIVTAHEGRVWTFLGYPSWNAYCVAELDTERITMPREERQELASLLSEQGLSMRAISSATGTSVGTVHSDLLSGVQNRTPDPGTGVDTSMPTTGLDGKTYKRRAAVEPTPKRRPPLVEGYTKALWDIDKIVRRLQRFHEDDRFASKRDQLGEGQAGTVEMLRNNLDDLLAELHGEDR